MPPLRKGARPAGGPVSGKEGSLRKRRRPHRGSPAVGKGDGEKTSSETCPSLRRRARGEMRRGKHPGRSGWYDVRAEGPGMPGMKRIRRKPCQCMKRIPRKPGRCRKACREENGLWDGRRKPGFQAMAWTYPPLFSHWLSGKGFLVSTESVLRPVRGGWVFRGLHGVHSGVVGPFEGFMASTAGVALFLCLFFSWRCAPSCDLPAFMGPWRGLRSRRVSSCDSPKETRPGLSANVERAILRLGRRSSGPFREALSPGKGCCASVFPGY